MKRILKTPVLIILLVLTIVTSLIAFSGCAGEALDLSDGEYIMPDEKPPVGTPDGDEDENLNPAGGLDEPEPDINPETEETLHDNIAMSPLEENSIVLTAQSLIGIEFADGGSSPAEGFDNSGFIYYVLRQNGYINSPRGLQEQAVMGDIINSMTELKSGDLVFFSENSERPQFGGIYIGDGIMISCRMPGEDVREFKITSSYYRENFFTGVRVI